MALSAFASFCRAAENQRFPALADRDDLWRLLVVLTVRKALHKIRDECREKRGGGHVLDENALAGPAPDGQEAGLEQVIGAEPTPAFAAQVAEECRRLLDLLGDRPTAVHRHPSHGRLQRGRDRRPAGCALRTVERKLQRIRGLWSPEKSS